MIRFDAGGRIEHHRRLHAVVGDQLERAVQVAAGLVVDADPVGPGVGKRGDELVGILDHQVAIERQVGDLAQAFHHRRPDGDVGHKMAVHDVDVDDRAAAALGRGNLVRQMGKIRREDGWQQLNHGAGNPARASVSAVRNSIFARILASQSFGALQAFSRPPAPRRAASL